MLKGVDPLAPLVSILARPKGRSLPDVPMNATEFEQTKVRPFARQAS